MMDFSALLLNPIYDVLGVSASLTPAGVGAVAVTITALDKTSGVDISGELDMMSLRPAAIVRWAWRYWTSTADRFRSTGPTGGSTCTTKFRRPMAPAK